MAHKLIKELKKIANKHNATPAQIALSWLVSFNKHVFTIPGATKIEQAKDNIEAMNIKLTNSEIEKLDYISKIFM